MAHKVKVGVIGAGKIFAAYVAGCRVFSILELDAVADLDTARSAQQAAEHGVPRSLSVDALLADPEIQIVVNLTVPKVHAAVSLAAIAAGKHVYTRSRWRSRDADGQRILHAATEQGVRVGSAPDTFLGGGQQTCRKLLDDGWIGEPVAAVAFMTGHGPEGWHPNPDFFYQTGGGPLLDMAPYYLTSLINLLGPVQRVAGSARISFAERIATSREHFRPTPARGSVYPRGRAAGLRRRADGVADHQLRHLARQPAAHRDLRLRRVACRCQTPISSVVWCRCGGPTQPSGATCRCCSTPRWGAASAWPTWLMPSAAAGRSEPATSWPSTC